MARLLLLLLVFAVGRTWALPLPHADLEKELAKVHVFAPAEAERLDALYRQLQSKNDQDTTSLALLRETLERLMDQQVSAVNEAGSRAEAKLIRDRIAVLQRLVDDWHERTRRHGLLRAEGATAPGIPDGVAIAELRLLLTEIRASDDPPSSDEIGWICGVSFSAKSRAAIELIVQRRPQLALKLIQDPSWKGRCILLPYLAATKYAPSLQLALLFSRVKNITFRVSAAHALGNYGGPIAFARLVEMIADPSLRVRNAVAANLVLADPVKGVPITVKLACESEENEVWSSAIDSLGVGVDPAQVARHALQYLDSGDAARVLRACHIFANIPAGFAVRKLVALAREGSPQIAHGAVRALRSTPGAGVEAALISLLGHRHPAVRSSAISTLAQREDFDRWHVIVECLRDQDDEVVENACWALGDSEFADAIIELRRLGSHRSEAVREAAGRAISSLGLRRQLREPLPIPAPANLGEALSATDPRALRSGRLRVASGFAGPGAGMPPSRGILV